MVFTLTCLLVFLLAPAAAALDDQPRIQGYEPTFLGYANDDDDVGYMDFRLSVRFGLLNRYFAGSDWSLFGSFSGRFGQYIGTRYSNPVVAKRFNPKLSLRWRCYQSGDLSGDSSSLDLDLSYAHESNGQSISTEAEFLNAEIAQANPPEGEGDAAFARDFISRGWDYAEIRASWKHSNVAAGKWPERWAIYANVRPFFKHGLLQKPWEEFNTWEELGDVTGRDQVHGLKLTGKFDWDWETVWDLRLFDVSLGGSKFAVAYTTGIAEPFAHSTLRAEGTLGIAGFPILVWVADGFQDDLAQYNRRVRSFGVGLEIKPFWETGVGGGPSDD